MPGQSKGLINLNYLDSLPMPPGTHHHHCNPDAHGADDVEFVLEDLFDGLRAGLGGGGQTKTQVTHGPAPGSPLPPHGTQLIPGAPVVPEQGLGTGWWMERRTRREMGGGSPKFGQEIREGRGMSPCFGVHVLCGHRVTSYYSEVWTLALAHNHELLTSL